MTGQKQSWAWLKDKYKCDMISAPVPGGAGQRFPPRPHRRDRPQRRLYRPSAERRRRPPTRPTRRPMVGRRPERREESHHRRHRRQVRLPSRSPDRAHQPERRHRLPVQRRRRHPRERRPLHLLDSLALPAIRRPHPRRLARRHRLPLPRPPHLPDRGRRPTAASRLHLNLHPISPSSNACSSPAASFPPRLHQSKPSAARWQSPPN